MNSIAPLNRLVSEDIRVLLVQHFFPRCSNGQLGTVSSSRRYKEDIAEMATASSAIMCLRPVTFR